MKATFEIEFADAQTAIKAAKVLGQRAVAGKGEMQCTANKSVLRAHISAKGFTALRALSTSLLRDAKIFVDAAALAKSAKATG